ncbi:helicase-related protein [Martelella mediterranea]
MILSGRGVTAMLGPTNTGKTHFAIERMVAHSSGVIGLPLRLLAREVYTRIVERVGVNNVALITGEEKIAPPKARFSVCTVEAMPREADVAFVAIDEVQLASDMERGHIFTDRILHLRGREETLLLGSATMRPILQKLLPGISVVERPRLSQLFYAGQKRITRLPRRSAVVAFSTEEVYAIAELIRRQRGGAAVVLGALSPRTRNAQVELYQNGDVEYLVATDAIGMGLNLDVDHVAFAQDRKFDGHQYRNLNPGELGQIAGRAGRHMRDGTFGVTSRVAPFDDELVERLQSHQFDPVRVLQWRSKALDFTSLDSLKASLDDVPRVPGLTRALPAVDQRALEFLARNPDVAGKADRRARIELLWEACALPDYRRITPAQHAELIASLYLDLVQHGTVDEDFLAKQVKHADRIDGEIDTLSARIAQIRTWTYVSNRPGWLADPTHWQEKTRKIEDRLSDALHERLTKRFVDRRTSVLMKRLRENAMLEAEVSVNGDVFVEGHHVGELAGFRFKAVSGAEGPDAKAIEAAALKALALEFEARAARLHASGNGDLALDASGTVRWLGDPVARLVASDNVLRPRVIVLADEQLTGPARDHVAARIERYVNHQIQTVLKPLDDLASAEDLEGIARGLAFQLVEAYGVLFRRDVANEVKSLDQDARASLRRYGVRFGAYHVFMPALLKPAPAEMITLLWGLKNDGLEKPGYGDLISVLAAGRTSVVTDPTFEREFYKLAGFRFLGKRAVRIDILERLADLIRPLTQWKPEGGSARPEGAFDGRRFVTTPAMMSILGATADDMEEILKGLGYRADIASEEEVATLAEIQAARDAEKAARQAPSGVTVETVAKKAVAEKSAEAEKPATEATETSTVAQETATSETSASDEAPAAETEATDAQTAEAPVTEAAKPVTDEASAPAAEKPEDTAQDAGQPTGETAGEDKSEEEAKPVLLWRQAGRNERNARPQQGRGQQRGEGRGRGQQGGRKGGEAGENRGDGERFGKNDRGGKGGKGGKGPRRDRNDDHANQRPPRREKEKPIDPDSPFAKLAALKAQMKR